MSRFGNLRWILAALLLAAPLPAEPPLRWVFNEPHSPYLNKLRYGYDLDAVVAGRSTDLERVQAVCTWVRKRWEHNGANEPVKKDPISILDEASKGKRFRCVEYGIVVSGALNALGIKARVVGLMAKDAQTRQDGAGHVVAEAYLPDQHRWVMIDGQWDVIPLLDGKPLSAYELGQALRARRSGITVLSFSNTPTTDYLTWIEPYLYYLDTTLDARFGEEGVRPYHRHSDALMLVPEGAPKPTVFQRTWYLNHMRYTSSPSDFYPAPR